MIIYEIGTGYTPVPARIGAATELVVEELTKAFQKQGICAEIVDIKAKERKANDLPITEVWVPGCFSGTDVKLGIRHKLKRLVYSVSLAGTLGGILKKSGGGVVFHFHNQYNLFFFLKLVPERLRKKCRIAYTNHSGIWRLEWEQIAPIIRRRYFQEAECMRRADMVFVLNADTRRNITEHLAVPQSRIRVIRNGVNTELYCPLPREEKEKAKRKWGLDGCEVVLQVGSVCDNKGQLRALKLLLPYMQRDPRLVYAYAGGIVEQACQAQIESFARENGVSGQVRYFGMLAPGEELNSLYNTALASILPSRYESFGLAFVESCAAGVPVLVDKTGPVCLGRGSLPYDEASFGSVLMQLEDTGSDAYRQLCEEARKNALENYSWDELACDHARSFAQMLEARSRR